jgi:hypothetical protein
MESSSVTISSIEKEYIVGVLVIFLAWSMFFQSSVKWKKRGQRGGEVGMKVLEIMKTMGII